MKLRFPFKSLRAGLLLTYLFLIASSLGLLAWRVGSSLDASRFAETQRDQEGRAILAASAAGDWLGAYREGRITQEMLYAEVNGLSREISQPATLLDLSGKVLVDAEHPENIDHDDSKEPEVAAALSGHVSNAIRFDPDDDGDVLFTIAPINYNHTLIGFVRLELPMRLVAEASQQFWLRIIAATMLAGAATALVSLLFARALTNPLARVTRAATALANGDLKQRINVTGPEELESLARGFNFMAERIEHVMEDQRAFVANAAHELRTPLTTIRLRAEALADGAKDDPEVAPHFLMDIIDETDRLSRLVGQLLDLSRIETGVVTPHREWVSVEAIARAVVDELMPRAVHAGITLTIDAPHQWQVLADPDQLRQVLINLLTNALEFTAPGGKIDVCVERVVQIRATTRLPAGAWVVTSIRDTGVGIASEDLPHIFDRFYRGDKSRRRETGASGTGLGLAIVKSIIDAHDGRIWVESQIGKGSVFAFALKSADLT
jgi:signal transduction histidine kinase